MSRTSEAYSLFNYFQSNDRKYVCTSLLGGSLQLVSWPHGLQLLCIAGFYVVFLWSGCNPLLCGSHGIRGILSDKRNNQLACNFPCSSACIYMQGQRGHTVWLWLLDIAWSFVIPTCLLLGVCCCVIGSGDGEADVVSGGALPAPVHKM